MGHRQRRIGEEMTRHLIAGLVDKRAKLDVVPLHPPGQRSRLEVEELANRFQGASPRENQRPQEPAKPRLEALDALGFMLFDVILDETANQGVGVPHRLRQPIGREDDDAVLGAEPQWRVEDVVIGPRVSRALARQADLDRLPGRAAQPARDVEQARDRKIDNLAGAGDGILEDRVAQRGCTFRNLEDRNAARIVEVEIANEIVERAAHIRRILDEEAEIAERLSRGFLAEEQADVIALRRAGGVLDEMPEAQERNDVLGIGKNLRAQAGGGDDRVCVGAEIAQERRQRHRGADPDELETILAPHGFTASAGSPRAPQVHAARMNMVSTRG